MGTHCPSLDNQKTRIEINSKRALATNIFAPSWSKKLFAKLDVLYGLGSKNN